MNAHAMRDFTQDVIERSRSIPVLVDFWADWCGPCRVLGPVLERIAERQRERFTLVAVNTEEHPDIAARYGVRSIPAVKLFVDGAVADEFTGALPESTILQWLERALPDPHRRALDAAEAMIGGGKAEEARGILDGILHGAPSHERARVLKARLLLAEDPDAAARLVAEIEAHSDEYQAAEMITTMAELAADARDPSRLPDDPVKELYRAAAQDAALGAYDAALVRFIGIIRSNRFYRDDGARKACIGIFRLLGDEHEITRARRREFSSALNS